MGLTLRNKGFATLKKKILHNRKYGRRGLHIAQFVQNGLFGKYLVNILETVSSEEELKIEIKILFDNIENRVVFIRTTDKLQQKIREIVTKIEAHSPNTFIISSIGSAKLNCETIKNGVMEQISSDYACELYASEQKNRMIYFLNRTIIDY